MYGPSVWTVSSDCRLWGGVVWCGGAGVGGRAVELIGRGVFVCALAQELISGPILEGRWGRESGAPPRHRYGP